MVLSRFFGMVFHADVEKKNSFFYHSTSWCDPASSFPRRTTLQLEEEKDQRVKACFFSLLLLLIAYLLVEHLCEVWLFDSFFSFFLPFRLFISFQLTTKANTYPPTPKRQYGNAFNPPSINNTSTSKRQFYTMKQFKVDHKTAAYS